MARKPRDFDAELQALTDKAKKVKSQKTTRLGELVQVLGEDSLPIEALAGALLAAIEQSTSVTILADRSFGDQKLFAFLSELGFGYVIRFRGDIRVTDAAGETRAAGRASSAMLRSPQRACRWAPSSTCMPRA